MLNVSAVGVQLASRYHGMEWRFPIFTLGLCVFIFLTLCGGYCMVSVQSVCQ